MMETPKMGERSVTLHYFKENGKYYSTGALVTTLPSWDVPTEVRRLRDLGQLPGLGAGARDFHILVDVENVPVLVLKT